ncbi:MAG: NUDIX hydrolase [Acidimicrobiia bacterium]|nr:NUDIX hydrolase [Acidimicrobiia bacterium]
MSENAPLLEWIARLSAIAQSGLTFSPNEFDRQRYEQVRSIAAEMAAWPDGNVESVEALFAGADGYATPKVICRAAVIDGGKILMVKETADGRWTLPGGWIDIGESPATAAEREVFEESGYRVAVRKLAAVYDKLRHDHPAAPHHSYLMFFVCDLIGGSAATSLETSEVGWFAPDHLPELSLNRSTRTQILRMFEHHAEPGLPTDFDVSLADLD